MLRDFCIQIDKAVESLQPSSILVVTDSNVASLVLPRLQYSEVIGRSPIITLPPGESHKTLESIAKIWNELEKTEATRGSVIINVGGGMVTDTGGFAAATFKRGIRYVNVATTLLGAVDAATGGKTGVNYYGLKNEIGSFHKPSAVLFSSELLTTLPHIERLSGYGEVLKTAIIADESLYKLVCDSDRLFEDSEILQNVIERCVDIKETVVKQDPLDKGLRKILNFGHTAGHAIEELLMIKSTKGRNGQIKPVAHGIAVAHGILIELILSHLVKGFDSKEMIKYRMLLRENFPGLGIDCKMIRELPSLMAHDKKNSTHGNPEFTLVEAIGKPVTGCCPSQEIIMEALDIYRDLME